MDRKPTWKDGLTFGQFRELVRRVLRLIRGSRPPLGSPKPDPGRLPGILAVVIPLVVAAGLLVAAVLLTLPSLRPGRPAAVSPAPPGEADSPSPLTIAQSQIPEGLPESVRDGIGRLYSPVPEERAHGALQLGFYPTEAAPAVPFLIALLRDMPHGIPSADERYDCGWWGPGVASAEPGFALAEPGEQAVEALASIGPHGASPRRSREPLALEIVVVVPLLTPPLPVRSWSPRPGGRWRRPPAAA